jgi:RNA polymerase sigma factor (sigma-70 family)
MPERRLSREHGRSRGPPAGRLFLRCQSDQRLVEQVQAGHDLAFEVIVERYRPQLLRYCHRLLSCGRAEDAVQQTFLNAYESIQNDSESRRLRPWLYRIAHNVAVDVLRKDGRVQEELKVDDCRAEPPEDVAERQEVLRAVIAALEALPDRQRNAILLRELEGRSYHEIATELGASGGAVRQLLNRARNALRDGAYALLPLELLLGLGQADVGQTPLSRIVELCATPMGGSALASACAAVAIAHGRSETRPVQYGARGRRCRRVVTFVISLRRSGGWLRRGRSATGVQARKRITAASSAGLARRWTASRR